MSEHNMILAAEPSAGGFLSSPDQFDHIQRVAKLFAASQLVPTAFQNNLPNVVVALEMASRQKASPLMVMQNLHVIHGRPSWSSSYIIASIATCGRFSPLRFVMEDLGEKTVKGTKIQDRSCYCWAESLKDGERLEGARVTVEMAVLEGWYTKAGSKWVTMPDLMLRYRAAAFFGRMYAPDVLMGMQTMEEVIDIDPSGGARVTIAKPTGGKGVAALQAAAVEMLTQVTRDAEPERLLTVAQVESARARTNGGSPPATDVPAVSPDNPGNPADTPPTEEPADKPKRGRPRKEKPEQKPEQEPEQKAEPEKSPEQPPAPEPENPAQPENLPAGSPEPEKAAPAAHDDDDDDDLPMDSVSRWEIEEVVERVTTRGVAYEIHCKGEDKPLYYEGKKADIPAEGTLTEFTFETRESVKRPGTFLRIAKKMEALA